MGKAARISWDDMPLYPTEEQIARAVLPPANVKAWGGIAAVLERRGFPAIDPLFGGRYWPAVKAFLDRRHGVGNTETSAVGPDGEENWDAPRSNSHHARPRA